MAKLIGTAGHVDHGKTTLIEALTGIDADRLPEEKRRGLTIDIGFAFVDLEGHGRVSIVDVPGHERFIANMLVGASGIDIAMLCVSADSGVMPQTKEHFAILDLLPVNQMVVALTRSDLADLETAELCELEVRELLSGSRFEDSQIVRVSAKTGSGLEELKSALGSALDRAVEPATGAWYMPIDRVFAVKGHGVVVTGTLAQGSVAVGDSAIIQPGGHHARIRAIHCHGDSLDEGVRGRRIALNLGGIKMEEVERGQAIGHANALFETDVFDARVRLIGELKHAQRVRVAVGSEESIGRAFLSDANPEVVQVRLENPLGCALNQPVILRRYSPPDLLGGGRIVVPQAKFRRKSETTKMIENTLDIHAALLEAIGDSQVGVETEEICRKLGRTAQELGKVFEDLSSDGAIVGFAGLWFQPVPLEASVQNLLSTLEKLHEANASQALLPRDKAIQAAGLTWSGKQLDRLLSFLASENRIFVSGTSIRHAAHQLRLSDKQEVFLNRVVKVLEAAGLNTPSLAQISLEVPAPRQAVDEIVRLGVEAGQIIRLTDDLYYSHLQIEELKAKVAEFSGNKPFTAAQFRDSVGTSRKFAIPLLEYLDKIRFTTRTGDNRMINR